MIILTRCEVIVCLLSLTLRSGSAAINDTESPMNHGAIQSDAPKMFDALKQKLEGEGWRQTNTPVLAPDLRVTATIRKGNRERVLKQGVLRYRWVVSLDPIDIEPGKSVTIYVSARFGESVRRIFELPGGQRT